MLYGAIAFKSRVTSWTSPMRSYGASLKLSDPFDIQVVHRLICERKSQRFLGERPFANNVQGML